MYLFFYKTNKKTALNRRFFVILSILQGVIPRHSERSASVVEGSPNQSAYPKGFLTFVRNDSRDNIRRNDTPLSPWAQSKGPPNQSAYPMGFLTFVRNDTPLSCWAKSKGPPTKALTPTGPLDTLGVTHHCHPERSRRVPQPMRLP